MLWDVSYCPGVAAPHGDAELQQLWTDLGSEDARLAHLTMCSLLSDPRQAVQLLGQRLRPISAMDAQRLAKVFNDLDHDRFPVREKATNELAKLGELAEPFLRQTLEAPRSLEVQRRVQVLLTRLETWSASAAARRRRCSKPTSGRARPAAWAARRRRRWTAWDGASASAKPQAGAVRI